MSYNSALEILSTMEEKIDLLKKHFDEIGNELDRKIIMKEINYQVFAMNDYFELGLEACLEQNEQ